MNQPGAVAAPAANNLESLLAVLDRSRPLLVQTHDNPDHDAVGAAFALAVLLARRGFRPALGYGGAIQSISLTAMIDRLGIDIFPIDDLTSGSARWQTIAVDGSPAVGTMRECAGELVAVVDHHPAKVALAYPFADVRLDVGSCCAIVWTYWRDSGETPDRMTATALLAGIQLDTDFLSRRVSPTDLEAHYRLFPLGDSELTREVVRTSLSVEQLGEIARAIGSARVAGDVLLAEVKGDYSSELLSVLADFLLRLREITFVVVVEVRGRECHLSARTRDREVDAGRAVKAALDGIGSGGGHPHMAGGTIPASRYPGARRFLRRIADAVAASRRTNEPNN